MGGTPAYLIPGKEFFKDKFYRIVGLLNHNLECVERLDNENQEVVDFFREGLEIRLSPLREKIRDKTREYIDKDKKRYSQAYSTFLYYKKRDFIPDLNPRAKKMFNQILVWDGEVKKKFDEAFNKFPPVYMWTPESMHNLSRLEELFTRDDIYSTSHIKGEFISPWVKSDRRTSHRFLLGRIDENFYVHYWFIMNQGTDKYDGVIDCKVRDKIEVLHLDLSTSNKVHNKRLIASGSKAENGDDNLNMSDDDLFFRMQLKHYHYQDTVVRITQFKNNPEVKKPHEKFGLPKSLVKIVGGSVAQKVVNMIDGRREELAMKYYDLIDADDREKVKLEF